MNPDQHPLTTARALAIWKHETYAPFTEEVAATLRAAYDAGAQDARDTFNPLAKHRGRAIRDVVLKNGEKVAVAILADVDVIADWAEGTTIRVVGQLTAFTTDDRTRRYTRKRDGTWFYRDLTGA